MHQVAHPAGPFGAARAEEVAMRLVILTALVSAASAAGQTVISERRLGTQIITEFSYPDPADPKAPKAGIPGPFTSVPPAKPALGGQRPARLLAKGWSVGRSFTDQDGKKWYLASGPAVLTHPPAMEGWLIEDPRGRSVFVQLGGSVFRLVGPPAERPRRAGAFVPRMPFTPRKKPDAPIRPIPKKD